MAQIRHVQSLPDARNFKAGQRRPWISATRRHIRQQLKANDWQARLMRDEATRTFTASLAPYPMCSGKHGAPLQRAQDIIGWIVQQGKFSAVDILTVALATDIMFTHWHGSPRAHLGTARSPYFRAVQIGKAIHKMLRAQVRVYVHDDGRGNVREETVRYKKGLTSRYVCQRLQGMCEAIYSDYKARHGHTIASLVACSEFKQSKKASRTYSRNAQSSLA